MTLQDISVQGVKSLNRSFHRDQDCPTEIVLETNDWGRVLDRFTFCADCHQWEWRSIGYGPRGGVRAENWLMRCFCALKGW
jgi:hypothetical protein